MINSETNKANNNIHHPQLNLNKDGAKTKISPTTNK